VMNFANLFLRPSEYWNLIKLKWEFSKLKKKHASYLREEICNPDLVWCHEMLAKVSRSFAFVIQELGEELRTPVCVFYLVLRALDTIEDDMSLDCERKRKELCEFHLHLQEESFSNMVFCGSGDERMLTENFSRVVSVFKSIRVDYQGVIVKVSKEMGRGMSEFLSKRIINLDDYNLYCHYVAGVVGEGLSQMFAFSSLEDSSIASFTKLSNNMGLFLQKTNIIRDYLEDINLKRIFWPEEIWKLYGDRLESFKQSHLQAEVLWIFSFFLCEFSHFS
jgi:farnesyl-diphosphate farnesyltransferase